MCHDRSLVARLVVAEGGVEVRAAGAWRTVEPPPGPSQRNSVHPLEDP